MKPIKYFMKIAALALLCGLIISSCQKSTDDTLATTETSASFEQLGRLKQTGTYSSDVLFRWIDFQLNNIYKTNVPALAGIAGSRTTAYTTIAAYEAVVPGMPAYQSLSGQLTDMPAMPQTKPGFAYYWPECLNAAMAYISKSLLFPQASSSVDDFETGLYQEFVNDSIDDVQLSLSADFGREVAKRIVEWSKTDKSAWPTTPFTTSTIFDPIIGKWVPTGTLASVSGPYWGLSRKLVEGSLNGINRINPYTYSTTPGSEFRTMAEQVYNNNYNPYNLSPEERKMIAIYYRDNPGYAGGHYLSIVKLVLAKAGTSLDQSTLVLAQAGISLRDALIGCWQVKYDQENNYVVRPVTYIKNVILGDPNTAWAPVIGTPNHPEYPSGHSTSAGSVAEVLRQHFGNNFSFTNASYEGMPFPEYPNGIASRSYASFDDMANEIADSRVYGQIHYPRSCVDGLALGKKVAQNILNKVKFLKQ